MSGVGAAGAAAGAEFGAALLLGATTAGLVSVGFIAKRSSSGATSALPSEGAKGS